MDTRFIVKRGKYTGRIAKSRLIQFILQEEYKAGGKPDCQRVMLLAQKRLEQYPQPMRDAAKLSVKDYRNALEMFNNNPTEIPPEKEDGEVPVPSKGLLPVSLEAFAKEELLRASSFLRHCGGSLSKAKQLLDFIYVLTRES